MGCLSVCLSVSPVSSHRIMICGLSACLSVCLSVSRVFSQDHDMWAVCLSACLSVCLSVCLSAYLSVCLSVSRVFSQDHRLPPVGSSVVCAGVSLVYVVVVVGWLPCSFLTKYREKSVAGVCRCCCWLVAWQFPDEVKREECRWCMSLLLLAGCLAVS